MTVKTYERIGTLITNIKRSKSIIDHNEKLIKEDFKELNDLLIKNGQDEVELKDIKPTGKYGCCDDEF